MKLKQLITGGALAATVLTLGSAQAEPNPYEGIVFCKAQIVSSGDSFENVSITLPFNSTTPGGEEYTYWNLGSVAAGGVADSWHSEGGPGKFVAHNNGGTGAYVYLTSAGEHYPYERLDGSVVDLQEIFEKADEFENTEFIRPVPSLRYLKNHSKHEEPSYCLAFSKDVTAKIPTWHMLDRWLPVGGGKYTDDPAKTTWRIGDEFHGNYEYNGSYYNEVICIGAYMGHLDAGEYMSFDVKFWAPVVPGGWDFQQSGDFKPNVRFTFRVEAAPFPLWEHDADVQ